MNILCYYFQYGIVDSKFSQWKDVHVHAFVCYYSYCNIQKVRMGRPGKCTHLLKSNQLIDWVVRVTFNGFVQFCVMNMIWYFLHCLCCRHLCLTTWACSQGQWNCKYVNWSVASRRNHSNSHLSAAHVWVWISNVLLIFDILTIQKWINTFNSHFLLLFEDPNLRWFNGGDHHLHMFFHEESVPM